MDLSKLCNVVCLCVVAVGAYKMGKARQKIADEVRISRMNNDFAKQTIDLAYFIAGFESEEAVNG